MTETPAPKLSRRKFLTLGLGTAAVAGGVVAEQTGIIDIFKDPLTPENPLMKVGAETKISLESRGIHHTPDTRMPYITLPDGQRRFFVSGNARSYALTGPAGSGMDPLYSATPEEVYGPDRSKEYRNGYGTINSVFSLDPEDPLQVMGITQNEQWRQDDAGGLHYENYTGTVGLAESHDGGLTWEDRGPLIQAEDALPPGKKVTGVGQPCALVVNQDGKKYLNIYYLYLPSKDGSPYQICLSRCPIGEDNQLQPVEHYTKSGFKTGEKVSPTEAKAVILPPSSMKDTYTALPTISYNTRLKKLLGIYETQNGFCASTSANGVDWSDGQVIMQFPQGQYPHKDGDVWYSNPSFISPDQPNDQTTSAKGYLTYSKGVWPEPHGMATRLVTLN